MTSFPGAGVDISGTELTAEHARSLLSLISSSRQCLCLDYAQCAASEIQSMTWFSFQCNPQHGTLRPFQQSVTVPHLTTCHRCSVQTCGGMSSVCAWLTQWLDRPVRRPRTSVVRGGFLQERGRLALGPGQ